jgi:hypothetical protein
MSPWWNSVVTGILNSPLHGLLSGSTMLVTCTGRKSGRAITVPVNYAETGVMLRATSLAGRSWWRNLKGGAPVTVTLRGRRLSGHALAIPGTDGVGEAAVAQGLRAFLAERPEWAAQFGVGKGTHGAFVTDDLLHAAKGRVLIEITLEHETLEKK